MARKVKVPTPLTPDQYIKVNGRSMAIRECLMTKNWKQEGLYKLLVVRERPTGNFTLGYFLVDSCCRGVISAYYNYDVLPNIYREIRRNQLDAPETESVPYEAVHNLVYGAISFARSLGFRPQEEFEVVKYYLENENADIPRIDFEFGKNGKPFLYAANLLEFRKFLPVLDRHVRNGNYSYAVKEEHGWEYEDDEEDFLIQGMETWEEMGLMDKIKDTPLMDMLQEMTKAVRQKKPGSGSKKKK